MDRIQLYERIPPQSLEMEQAVLGSMLIERQAIEVAADILHERDFYRLAHGVIFDAILSLIEQDEPVDLLSVQEELRRKEVLENIGGAPYLVQLTDAVPTAANIEHYAGIVGDCADRRRIINACHEIMQRCHDDHDEEIVQTAESIIYECSQGRTVTGQMTEMRPAVAKLFEFLEGQADSGNPFTGLRCGIGSLDKMLNGLKPANLIVIAARPGMGKTALAINIATHAARYGSVAIFSLEMTTDELMLRMVSGLSRVDSRALEEGRIRDSEWRAVGEACANISELPIYVCEATEVTPAGIRSKLRRVQARQKLSLVVVDYLQLLTPSRRSDNRAQEVGELSRALKGIAREFNIPVIAAAQINRDSTKRTDKRPQMSELRESGSIEAEADVVALIHRPRYYQARDNGEECRGFEEAEIIVDKQRKGPTGIVKVGFWPEWTLFADFAKEVQP